MSHNIQFAFHWFQIASSQKNFQRADLAVIEPDAATVRAFIDFDVGFLGLTDKFTAVDRAFHIAHRFHWIETEKAAQ